MSASATRECLPPPNEQESTVAYSSMHQNLILVSTPILVYTFYLGKYS